MQFALNFRQRVDCTNEQNKKYEEMVKHALPLPEGVFQYKSMITDDVVYEFYTICDCELDEKEKQEYIMLKQLENIVTIKKCVLFFTITAIASMILTALVLMIN